MSKPDRIAYAITVRDGWNAGEYAALIQVIFDKGEEEPSVYISPLGSGEDYYIDLPYSEWKQIVAFVWTTVQREREKNR